MVRSNLVWCVLCLTAVWGVPVAAQERSDASIVWIDVPPTEVNRGALFQEPSSTRAVWIETIRIKGGKVEIVGDSIKIDGGKVEIIRVTPGSWPYCPSARD